MVPILFTELETLNAWEETSLCRLSKLKRWPNPSDECEYYSCAYFNTSITTDCSGQVNITMSVKYLFIY